MRYARQKINAPGVPSMSTDPKRGLGSTWQEHDVWYVVDRVQDSFWRQLRPLIQQVVESCKEQVKPIQGREKLLAVAMEKMRVIVEEGGLKSRDPGEPGKYG
jgi:hypothetical protein